MKYTLVSEVNKHFKGPNFVLFFIQPLSSVIKESFKLSFDLKQFHRDKVSESIKTPGITRTNNVNIKLIKKPILLKKKVELNSPEHDVMGPFFALIDS